MRLSSCFKLTILSFAFLHGMHAQTVWDGDQGDNLWTTPLNWDNGVPVVGQPATINNSIQSQLTGANGFASDLFVQGTSSNLLINSGAVLNLSGTSSIGALVGTSGTITATDSGTQWMTGNLLAGVGGGGTVNIQNGATLTSTVAANLGLNSGAVIGVGSLTATGTNTLWTSGDTNVGFGGSGVVNIQNNAHASFTSLVLGQQSVLSGAGSGELNLSGDSLVTAGSLDLGASVSPGVAVVTISDGAEAFVTDLTTMRSSNILNLFGTPGSQGLLSTQRLVGSGSLVGGIVNFDGGILQANSNQPFFISGVSLNVSSEGAFLDSFGFTVGTENAFLGSGAITKQGTGIFNFSGALINDGGLIVDEGTASSVVFINGPVVVNNTGVLDASGNLLSSLTLNDLGQATIQATSSVIGPVVVNNISTLTANGPLNSSLTVNDASIAHINTSVVGPFVANGGITNFNAPSTLDGTATINNGSVLLAAGATFNDTTTVSGGSLVANGTINADLITSGNSFLSGSGSAASLTNGGTFSPGDGIGTFTVVGNHINTPSGTHQNELNASGQTDLLAVGGTSTIQGGTLDIQAAPGNYLAGTSYTLITAAGGLSGQFANVIDNLPINYLLFYFPDSLVLRLGDAIITDGLTCNARRVADYINSFSAASLTTGDFFDVLLALESLGSDDLSDALDHLQPASFQALSITSGDAAHAVNDSFMDRLNFLRITRCGQCCDPCDQGGVWISGLANYVSFDRVGCVRGFDATNGGFAIGYDKCFCDDIIAGVGAGYSNNYIKWNRHFGHSDGQNAYLGVYATQFNEDYYADLSLLGFKGTYKSKRHIEFADIDRRAKSKQCNWGINPHFGSGLILDYCGFDVIPFGEIDYYYLSQDKFREHGANSLNLHVKSNDASALRLETGVRFAKAYDCGCGQFLPYASISYVGHRYYGRKFKSSFNDQSNDFSVFGVDRCFNQAEFGLGLAYLINDQFAINASYDIDVGSKRQQQEFNFELNYRF